MFGRFPNRFLARVVQTILGVVPQIFQIGHELVERFRKFGHGDAIRFFHVDPPFTE